jgi:hypothetical protein
LLPTPVILRCGGGAFFVEAAMMAVTVMISMMLGTVIL